MGIIKRFSCKECTDRSEDCHGTCEKYLEEKARLEQIKQLKERDRAYMDYKYNRDMTVYKKLSQK